MKQLRLRGIFDQDEATQVHQAFVEYLDTLGSVTSPHIYNDATIAWFSQRGWEVHNVQVDKWPGDDMVLDVHVKRCRPYLPCPKCNKLHNLPDGDYICDQCRAALPS